MNKIRILVVDDQYGRWEAHRKSFMDAVAAPQRMGLSSLFDFTFCSGQVSGHNSLPFVTQTVRERWFGASSTEDVWSLVLLDIRFDEEGGGGGSEFGFELLENLREHFGRALPIVMLTREDRDDARRLSNRGLADGFLHKQSLSSAALEERVLEHGLFPDVRRTLFSDTRSSAELVGSTLPFLMTLREARRVAMRSSDGCLVVGETGSGKTELAGLIHDHSERRRRRFKKWTAEGLREDLMKGALFGHWKGAHSLATTSEPGEIEKCDSGTFFLDEIANLTPGVQELFLELRRRDERGLRTITRLGTFPTLSADVRQAKESVVGELLPTHAIEIDVALIAATNQNILGDDTLSATPFRRDLVNAFGRPIVFPPLNARRSDIPLLFDAFVKAVRGNRHFAVDSEVHAALQAHDWSDKNIVILKRIAERAAQEARDFDEILPHHVPEMFEKSNVLTRAAAPDAPALQLSGGSASELIDRAATDPNVDLRGALSAAQIAYLRLVLRLFGAALRATQKKDGRTTTLDALCILLGVPRLAASARAQSKKSYDILRNLLSMAEVNCSHRSVMDCLAITDETISIAGEGKAAAVLSDDSLVVKHVRQALQSRAARTSAETK